MPQQATPLPTPFLLDRPHHWSRGKGSHYFTFLPFSFSNLFLSHTLTHISSDTLLFTIFFIEPRTELMCRTAADTDEGTQHSHPSSLAGIHILSQVFASSYIGTTISISGHLQYNHMRHFDKKEMESYICNSIKSYYNFVS